MVVTLNQGSITHINLDININRIYVAWPMAAILNSKMYVTPIILILHSMDCLTLNIYGYNFKSRFYHIYINLDININRIYGNGRWWPS